DIRTGWIADLFTAPDGERVAAALLTAALDDLWAQGAEWVRALASPGAPLNRLLRAGGLRPAPGAFPFELVPLDPGLDLAALSDPAAWLLTGGDFDVV